MADYPASIYEPRTKENKPGTVYTPSNTTEAYAEDVSFLDAEVVAIETILGLEPEGDFDDVVGRLDDLDTSIAGLVSDLAGKQDSLGFTPENVANKDTNVALGTDNTKYPSQGAVKSYVDTGLSGKQNSLGYTAENVANKDTNVALGTDNTKYPSQGAVKSYVDTGLSGKQDSLGFTAVPNTRTVNGHALSADVTVSQSDVGLGNVDNTSNATERAATATLTNKRVTRRVVTTNAPGATPTTNSDNVDIRELTGLNAAITSMSTNLSGTPVNGDFMEIIFLDDGTARAITWGTSFASSTVTLPTTTVISTALRVLLQYQTAGSLNKWVCVAVV